MERRFQEKFDQRLDDMMAGAKLRSGGSAQRWSTDRPPEWDGLDAENQLRPFLKLYDGWVETTGCPLEQRGLELLRASKGTIRLMMDALEHSEPLLPTQPRSFEQR